MPRPIQHQWKGNEFCLVDLPPVLRLEFLLILQQRDRQGYRLDPRIIRRCLHIALESRVRTMETLHRQLLEQNRPRRLELGLTNYGRLCAARWRYRFSGQDMRHEDLWDAAVLELRVDQTTQRRCSKGTIDFTPITVGWLKDAAKQYATTLELPADQVRELVRSCTIASQALLKRPNGPRPGRLQRENARAVFDAYANLTAADGTARTARLKHDMFSVFKRLLRDGRELPALHELAPAFRFLSADRLDTPEKPTPEKPTPTSKAIPDSVIRILDNNLHLLSVTAESPYAMGRPPELHSHMLQTIYQLLRDLGRRPTEVLALQRDALHHSDDRQPFIRYDAPKTGDYGLELPIHTSTATIIKDWTARINTVTDIHPHAAQYLFPSLCGFGPAAKSHISPTGFHTHYWRWIDRIKELPEYVNGPEGTARYFDRSKLNLYAWHHTYAQRLSDNNTPPDVIKDLMNHKRFETSAGYIQMNRKRKEEAIRIVSTTTVNRDGTASAPGEYTAYLRSSVATPLGLCTEPSNVKAGGQACPARSKCGGCSYFRANISHLPVIDSHIVALTADLELAAPLAEDWILQGINAEIASYKRIRTLLTQAKNTLTTEQQAEIDQATDLLQNLAAAPTTIGQRTGPKLLPLTPKRR
ncbi:site-specific integrase [Arthrobacter sp. H41]|uniref:site-specific integrase n=1 Tax=Arthrobacter sp. H41 TaxID=1312978 RepID=UPI0006766CEE|nr:site-specific integrase [Arthrobacter sp. H41]